jgi:glycosyltransferase involved in cell wall biosynthesis
MFIVGFGNNSGSKYWRLVDPFKYLRRQGHTAFVSEEGINESILSKADVVVLQSVVNKEDIALVRAYQKEKGLVVIADCDDSMELNEDNPHIMEHKVSEAYNVLPIVFNMVNMITTTTPYLAKKLKEYNENTYALANSMDLERWDLPKYKNESGKIRIGYLGSLTHLDDFRMLNNVFKRLNKEFNNLMFVTCGDPRWERFLQGLPHECMLGVPFEAYPAKLHAMRLDIGVAPLRNTPFNRCKSNIKFLEYSIAGIPAVYSPTVYNFRGFEPTFGVVADTEEQWFLALSNYIKNPEFRKDVVEAAQVHVRTHYDLKHNVKLWDKAYNLATKIKIK